MEDQTLREELRAYVFTGEPPLHLDFQKTLAAARRSRRRRLIAAATATVAGVAVIALAAATLPGIFGVGNGVAPASRCGTPGKDWGPPQPRWEERFKENRMIPAEPTQHAEKRLTCVLSEVLLPKLPAGAKLARPKPTPALHIPAEGAATDVFSFSQASSLYYQLPLDVTDTKGTGRVSVTIGLTIENYTEQLVRTCANSTKLRIPFCEVRKGPRGETILVRTGNDLGPGVISYGVEVHHLGTRVEMYTSNTAHELKYVRPPTNDDKDPPVIPERPTPPITLENLITAATAPELTLYPAP
ncbi:hypothetical protein [Crossiella cryophila]|uniref:Uncharacterized protein n=1 Tax=Crossiella cryophila TaxID=43355 RepID=A0A7W7FYQ1_9PSEU|nr:hypothetical protein [Crossiella cryophila]MBB4680274.1 hypothetical protein [Crossiella cryophila]